MTYVCLMLIALGIYMMKDDFFCDFKLETETGVVFWACSPSGRCARCREHSSFLMIAHKIHVLAQRGLARGSDRSSLSVR